MISCAQVNPKADLTYEDISDEEVLSETKIPISQIDPDLDKRNNPDWQNQYYKETMFIVTNPKVFETKRQLDLICRGDHFTFTDNYPGQSFGEVLFKKKPITIQSKKGFSKKVFVTRGVCRELVLFKSKSQTKVRKSIAKVKLHYVYNHGTYLTELEFDTEYSDVKFIVR